MENSQSDTSAIQEYTHTEGSMVIEKPVALKSKADGRVDSAMITLELIEQPSGFQQLGIDWKKLQDQQQGGISRSFSWLLKAYKHGYLNDVGAELSIIVGRHEGEVVFILPLMKSYPRGVVQLKLIEDEQGNSSTFLLKEHPSNKEWMDRTWWFLNSAIDFDCLSIRGIRQHSLMLAFMKEQKATCIQEANGEYHCLLSRNFAGQAYNSVLQGHYAASGIYNYIRTIYSSLT